MTGYKYKLTPSIQVGWYLAKSLSVNLTVYSTYGFMANTQPQKNVIKTHDSESRGQEEAAIICETKITRPLSELFTRKTAKKIANALAKLP